MNNRLRQIKSASGLGRLKNAGEKFRKAKRELESGHSVVRDNMDDTVPLCGRFVSKQEQSFQKPRGIKGSGDRSNANGITSSFRIGQGSAAIKFVIVTLVACGLAAFRSEEIYFRFTYGPRVSAREIRLSGINDQSLGIIIRGERYWTDDSRAVVEEIFWLVGKRRGSRPDTRVRGVWQTSFEDRPYVVKVGRETLFAHPAE